MCSSAPDTSGLNAAAVAQTDLSREQLDWFKQIYNETAPERAKATANAQRVTDANLSMMDTQTNLGKDYDQYNKTTFRPLEKGIVADAQNYDTQDRREAEAGKAVSDVSQNIDAAQAQADMDMARAGIDPSSGRALAIRSTMGLSGALGKTQAGANARRAVETTGFARRMDAASLGRGLPSAQSTAAGLGLNAGSASLNSSMAPIQVANTGANLMQTGFDGAGRSLSGASNTMGNIATIQNQASAANNAIYSGLGSVVGAGIGKRG